MPACAAAGTTAASVATQRTVRAMLFADVAGFSGLPEPHLPAFFIEFLAMVEEQLKTTPTLFQNTWGDGLYLVFADVVACADFALRLLRRLERFDFASFGFKLKEDKKPGVRIGLHTGPGLRGLRRDHRPEELLRQPREPGRADRAGDGARAARSSASSSPPPWHWRPGHDFVCEYLGLQPLAKDYDVCPLYRLTDRTDRGVPG